MFSPIPELNEISKAEDTLSKADLQGYSCVPLSNLALYRSTRHLTQNLAFKRSVDDSIAAVDASAGAPPSARLTDLYQVRMSEYGGGVPLLIGNSLSEVPHLAAPIERLIDMLHAHSTRLRIVRVSKCPDYDARNFATTLGQCVKCTIYQLQKCFIVFSGVLRLFLVFFL